ncbi:MAG: nucleotidyltransferase family protein [Leptospiraceae bacterium]|nr:nucleotidyltransferase family protein [Leptospiraceae bacterium]
MKTLSEIKSVLLAEKPLLQERYGVKELGIFGSYTRNENRTDSDLDILVEFFPDFPITLLKFINMENYLQDKLKTKIDLVMKDGLKEELKPIILKEVVYL